MDNPAQALRAQTSVAGIVRYVEAINVMGSEGRAVTTARLSDHLAVAVPSVTARLRRLLKKGCIYPRSGWRAGILANGKRVRSMCHMPFSVMRSGCLRLISAVPGIALSRRQAIPRTRLTLWRRPSLPLSWHDWPRILLAISFPPPVCQTGQPDSSTAQPLSVMNPW